MRIAVLMTVHNRRETTIRCLERLLAQMTVGADGEERTSDLFLVDDGSTDGTSEAVKGLFRPPHSSSLHLIHGNGSLYWAKGMELAWRSALEEEKRRAPTSTLNSNYSGFLWLNDDVELDADALSRLEADSRSGDKIVVGELENVKGEMTYGLRGDLFTGNFVFVPRAVYEKLGLICGEYAHAWADSDYAMRAKHAGIGVVSCGVVGRCEGHELRPSLRGRDLRWRWRSLWDPKGWCVHDVWLYKRRNFGFLQAVVSSVHLVLHVLFLI